MNIVEEYWAGAVQRLQVEVDVFNRLIGHAGEQGRENELALSRVLQNLIPRRLGVGSGIIIDSKNNRSKQTDIIIYDSADQPTLLAQTSQVIFPVETVYAAVEVKTTLTPEELRDCGAKRDKLLELSPTDDRYPTFVVLAYAASMSPGAAARNILALAEGKPDLLCILDPGIVSGAAVVGETYRIGLTPLHERDEQGERIAGTWVRPMEDKPVRLHRFGFSYPLTLLKGDRITGEPGRALLLFLDALLRILAQQRAIPSPALTDYLTPVAREIIDLAD